MSRQIIFLVLIVFIISPELAQASCLDPTTYDFWSYDRNWAPHSSGHPSMYLYGWKSAHTSLP